MRQSSRALAAFLCLTLTAGSADSAVHELSKAVAPINTIGAPHLSIAGPLGTRMAASPLGGLPAAGVSAAAAQAIPALAVSARPAAPQQIASQAFAMEAPARGVLSGLAEVGLVLDQDAPAGELKAAEMFTGQAARPFGALPEPRAGPSVTRTPVMLRPWLALNSTLFLAATKVNGLAADPWNSGAGGDDYSSPFANDMMHSLKGFLYVVLGGMALTVGYIVFRAVRTMREQSEERKRAEQRLDLRVHKVTRELAGHTEHVVKPMVLETAHILKPKRVSRFGPGEAIMDVGEVAKTIYKVKKGRVVVLSATGNPIGSHDAGEFFGLYAFLGGGRIRSAKVVAAEDGVEVEEYSKEEFLAHLDENPGDRARVYEAARQSMLGNVDAFPRNPASAQALGAQSSEAERRSLFVHLMADLEERFQSKDAVYVVVHVINMLALKATQMHTLAGARLGGVQANLGAENKLASEMEGGFLFERTLHAPSVARAPSDVVFLMANALQEKMTPAQAQAIAASLGEKAALYVSGPDDKGVRAAFEKLGFKADVLIGAPSGLPLTRLTYPRKKK